MSDPRTSLPQYVNTFDRAKGFQALAFHYDRYVQSHEFNTLQDIERDRLKRIADAFLKDGALKSGGKITLSAIVANQVTATLEAAEVYIRGAMHDVPARVLVLPADRVVVVGIRLRTYTVSHPDDPTLKGLAPGTRAEGEPGASALVMKARWGWGGDGEEGDFFPIYTIDHGILVSEETPLDTTWLDLLARYDREAHGGYVVEGFRVQALGHDDGHQVFSVSEGTINVWGYKRSRAAALRLRVPEEPEIHLIDDEPHAVGAGPQTITVRFAPIAEIVEVTITAEKTVTLTHGAYSGASDALPDPTVLSLIAVTQGATTYTTVTDYKLTGGAVDWSPGGAEPAPGSTYTVTYLYFTNATPSALTRDSFQITGAATGTVALVKYRMKLPRVDAIVADRDGRVSYLKGISSLYAPQPLRVAPTLVKLADVINDWGLTADVRQVGTVRMPFADLRDLEQMVANLYALVAEERLQRDVDRKEVSAKRGVFVDPLLDDDMRDQGLSQSAAIFDGQMCLPITPTVTPLTLPAPAMLDIVEEIIFEQPRITGTTRINPYQVFDPPPTACELTPAQDQWSEEVHVWTSATTQRFAGSGSQSSTSTSVETRVLSSVTERIEHIRQRAVTFRVEHWGPNEQLVKLTFDGIDVTPSV